MAKKTLIYYLAIAMFIIAIALRVEATFASSRALALPEIDRNADLGNIQAVFE